MATVIQFKSSSTAGASPVANDLSNAELAINTVDGRLYTKRSSDNAILSASFLEHAVISTNSATTTSTASTAIDTFATSDYRIAKYLIQISSGSDYQATEILFMHDGTTVYLTEYATITTSGGILGVFDGQINSSNAELLVESTSATSTVYKLTRIGVKA